MRIFEDFFDDINTVDIKEQDNSEFPFTMTAYTTKQLSVYVIADEHVVQQPIEYYMEIIRDKWNKDAYAFNKIISQMSFISDYKILYGTSNIRDRIYLENTPYKYYDNKEEFIADGLREFETCSKQTDVISI